MLGNFMNYCPKEYQVDLRNVFTNTVENSVDPDQLASHKPADLDLHCFQNRIYTILAW